MNKKNKIILFALVVLLSVAVALWLQKGTPPVHMRSVETPIQTPTLPPVAVNQSQLPKPPNQTKTNPSDAVPKKKFAEMDFMDRNAILTEMEKQDLSVIFQAMLDAGRMEHDTMKQLCLQTTFAGILTEKKPSPEFLGQLRAFVSDSSNSQFERDLLMGALRSTATLETTELLAQLAMASRNPKLREAAAAGLATAGALDGGGEKLSPTLERVWRESNDPALLVSTSVGMAKIGASSSIELLLSAALATDDRDKVRHDTAQYALQKVYLPNAVPPLAARLADQSPTSESVKLVAPILARIGDPSASKALVSWLQGRSESAAPLIHDLIVQQMRGDPFQSAWAAALDPKVPFSNEENRKAIRDALAAYRAGRTSR